MRLEQFNVGDLVRNMMGVGPADLHSEILYIGEQMVLLRNSNGIEFSRERDAAGFEYWQREKTFCEFRVTAAELRMLGDDLVAAIQHAAWNDDVGSNNLSGPTDHMRTAIDNWLEFVRRV